MPALITELIDKVDNSEVVRDQIAAILLVELANQQALAVLDDRDPTPWLMRVYTERANPWAEFLESPENQSVDASPIVNVSFESATYPMSGGNTVEQQRAAGIFHIDCYGYGVSEETTAGHLSGDESAALEAQRAVRLVRNILMAGQYTYLGLRGLVGRRWPQAINMYQPTNENRAVQHVVAGRFALQVDFQEYAPQVQGLPMTSVFAQVKRSDNGQLLLRAQYLTSE